MRKSSWQSAVGAAVLVTCSGIAGSAQTASSAVEQFTAATREYALAHRRIERAVGPLTVTASPVELMANVNAIGDGIRGDRVNARQGDLFTPQLSAELRERIADALAARGLTPADVTTDEIPEGINRSALVVRVGGPFPWAAGFNVLPTLIEALPELPPELQYRFVFRDLVLVDVHANLVVDVLPQALAATEF